MASERQAKRSVGFPSFRKSIWALVDQWLFSGTNFLVAILLARWLSPEDYGAFALAFAIFLLLAAIHTAIISDPMLVYGAGRYKHRLDQFLAFIFRTHLRFSVSGLVLVAVAFLVQPPLTGALLGAGVALPAVLLFWLVRRSYYIESQPQRAARASAIYCVLALGSLIALDAVGRVSPWAAFLVFGLSSALLCAPWLKFIKEQKQVTAVELREMQSGLFEYARWSGFTSLLIWLPLNVYFLLLTQFAGLSEVAELRALTNLFNPLNQSLLAITTLLLPEFSALHQQRNSNELRSRFRIYLFLFTFASVIYGLVFNVLQQPLIDLLYGGRYSSVGSWVWLAALPPILFGIGSLLETMLRAMEQPRRVFVGYLAAGLVALTTGVALTAADGVRGAITSQLLAYAALCLVLIVEWRSLRSSS